MLRTGRGGGWLLHSLFITECLSWPISHGCQIRPCQNQHILLSLLLILKTLRFSNANRQFYIVLFWFIADCIKSLKISGIHLYSICRRNKKKKKKLVYFKLYINNFRITTLIPKNKPLFLLRWWLWYYKGIYIFFFCGGLFYFILLWLKNNYAFHRLT